MRPPGASHNHRETFQRVESKALMFRGQTLSGNRVARIVCMLSAIIYHVETRVYQEPVHCVKGVRQTIVIPNGNRIHGLKFGRS